MSRADDHSLEIKHRVGTGNEDKDVVLKMHDSAYELGRAKWDGNAHLGAICVANGLLEKVKVDYLKDEKTGLLKRVFSLPVIYAGKELIMPASSKLRELDQKAFEYWNKHYPQSKRPEETKPAKPHEAKSPKEDSHKQESKESKSKESKHTESSAKTQKKSEEAKTSTKEKPGTKGKEQKPDSKTEHKTDNKTKTDNTDSKSSPEKVAKPQDPKAELKQLRSEFSRSVAEQRALATELKAKFDSQKVDYLGPFASVGQAVDIMKSYVGGSRNPSHGKDFLGNTLTFIEKGWSNVLCKDDSSLALMKQFQTRAENLSKLKTRIDEFEKKDFKEQQRQAQFNELMVNLKTQAKIAKQGNDDYDKSQKEGVEAAATAGTYLVAVPLIASGVGIPAAAGAAAATKMLIKGVGNGDYFKAGQKSSDVTAHMLTDAGTGSLNGLCAAAGMWVGARVTGAIGGKIAGAAATNPFVVQGCNAILSTEGLTAAQIAAARLTSWFVNNGLGGATTTLIESSWTEGNKSLEERRLTGDGHYLEHAQKVAMNTGVSWVTSSMFSMAAHGAIKPVNWLKTTTSDATKTVTDGLTNTISKFGRNETDDALKSVTQGISERLARQKAAAQTAAQNNPVDSAASQPATPAETPNTDIDLQSSSSTPIDQSAPATSTPIDQTSQASTHSPGDQHKHIDTSGTSAHHKPDTTMESPNIEQSTSQATADTQAHNVVIETDVHGTVTDPPNSTPHQVADATQQQAPDTQTQSQDIPQQQAPEQASAKRISKKERKAAEKLEKKSQVLEPAPEQKVEKTLTVDDLFPEKTNKTATSAKFPDRETLIRERYQNQQFKTSSQVKVGTEPTDGISLKPSAEEIKAAQERGHAKSEKTITTETVIETLPEPANQAPEPVNHAPEVNSTQEPENKSIISPNNTVYELTPEQILEQKRLMAEAKSFDTPNNEPYRQLLVAADNLEHAPRTRPSDDQLNKVVDDIFGAKKKSTLPKEPSPAQEKWRQEKSLERKTRSGNDYTPASPKSPSTNTSKPYIESHVTKAHPDELPANLDASDPYYQMYKQAEVTANNPKSATQAKAHGEQTSRESQVKPSAATEPKVEPQVEPQVEPVTAKPMSDPAIAFAESEKLATAKSVIENDPNLIDLANKLFAKDAKVEDIAKKLWQRQHVKEVGLEAKELVPVVTELKTQYQANAKAQAATPAKNPGLEKTNSESTEAKPLSTDEVAELRRKQLEDLTNGAKKVSNDNKLDFENIAKEDKAFEAQRLKELQEQKELAIQEEINEKLTRQQKSNELSSQNQVLPDDIDGPNLNKQVKNMVGSTRDPQGDAPSLGGRQFNTRDGVPNRTRIAGEGDKGKYTPKPVETYPEGAPYATRASEKHAGKVDVTQSGTNSIRSYEKPIEFKTRHAQGDNVTSATVTSNKWTILSNEAEGIKNIRKVDASTSPGTVKVSESLVEDFPHLANKEIPNWVEGNADWLYTQANTQPPNQIGIYDWGGIGSIRYSKPVTISEGPFKGLIGDEIKVNKDSWQLIDNTVPVGNRSKAYTYRPTSTQTNQLIEETTNGNYGRVNHLETIPQDLMENAPPGWSYKRHREQLLKQYEEQARRQRSEYNPPQIIDESTKAINQDALLKELKEADWHYGYSDDGAVWARGQKQISFLIQTVKEAMKINPSETQATLESFGQGHNQATLIWLKQQI